MGNCCGKSSADGDNFHGQGRTLDAAPATAPSAARSGTASVPPGASRTGRTVGGTGSASQTQSQTPGAAAARAAEERAKASQGKGKLGKQLDAQKSLSQTAALSTAARDNVAAREADAAHEARSWN